MRTRRSARARSPRRSAKSDQPADQRGRCIALFNGDEVATAAPPEAAPDNAAYEQENAARAMTVSLVSSDR